MSSRLDQTKKTEWKRVLAPAVISFLAFSVKLDDPGFDGAALELVVRNLLSSFQGFRVANAIQLPCLVLLYDPLPFLTHCIFYLSPSL